MGLVPASLEMLMRHIQNVGGLPGIKMMELGDQQMYCHHNVPEASAAKAYFQHMGVKHTSIDLNGELGAISLDLGSEIRQPEWQQTFDVVTDFGTSEHVGPGIEKLYNCRSNCHWFCRPGGLMIFMNPRTGQWPGHGFHYFTSAHYQKLAEICGYQVLEISEHPTLGNDTTGWQVHAAFIRGMRPFPTLEDFVKLCEGTVFPS